MGNMNNYNLEKSYGTKFLNHYIQNKKFDIVELC